FPLMQYQGEGEASHLFLPSGGQGWRRDLLPDLESFPQFLTVGGRGKPMPARAEVLGEGARGREKTLGVPWGFKPLHVLLPLTGGLVGILRAVVKVPMLAMFYPGENLALGRSVTLQFVSDDDAWHVGQALEQLTKKLLCGSLVSATLHQDIE